MRGIPLLLLAAPLAASAQDTAPDWADKSGAVGLGANTTLGGTNGLSVRTYVTPLVGLELNFGLGMHRAVVGEGLTEVKASTLAFDIGVYGSYKLAYWQRGSLAGLLGLDVVAASSRVETAVGDTETSANDLLVGLGLRGEYFPTQYLSLHLDAGLRIDFVGNEPLVDTVPTDPVDATQIGVGDVAFGSAGFTVWFR